MVVNGACAVVLDVFAADGRPRACLVGIVVDVEFAVGWQGQGEAGREGEEEGIVLVASHPQLGSVQLEAGAQSQEIVRGMVCCTVPKELLVARHSTDTSVLIGLRKQQSQSDAGIGYGQEGDGGFYFPGIVIVESTCQLCLPERAFFPLLGRQSEAHAVEEYEKEKCFFHR